MLGGWSSILFGKNTGKHLILDTLSSDFPLSARKIHALIIKQSGCSITYQAVHKFLKELVKDSVLLENDKEYMINTAWLVQLVNHVEMVKQHYCGGPGKMAEPPNLLKNIADYRASFINSIEKYISHQLPLVKRTALVDNVYRQPSPTSQNLLEQFNNEHRMVLLGDPGAGKTTAAATIAYHYCRESNIIPIIVHLRYVQTNDDLTSIILQKIFEHTNIELDAAFVEKLLQEGSFLIVYDGLDEVFPRSRKKTLYNIQRALALYRKNLFLITCRKTHDPMQYIPLAAFELQGLTLQQIKMVLFQSGAEELYHLLKSDAHLQTICSNPLLLKLALETYSRSSEHSLNECELFSAYIDEMLYARLGENTSHKLAVPNIRSTLMSMALTSRFDEKQLTYELMSESLNHHVGNKNAAFAYEVLMTSQLIRVRKHLIEFSHPLIQDYLCALELSRRYGAVLPTILIDKLSDIDEWHSVIEYYCSEQPDNKLLAEFYDRYCRCRDVKVLFLLANILKSNLVVKGKLFENVIQDCLQLYLLPDQEFYQYWRNLNNLFSQWNAVAVRNRIVKFVSRNGGTINPRMLNIFFHSKNNFDIALYKEIFEDALKSDDDHLKYSIVELIGQFKLSEYLGTVIAYSATDDYILKALSLWVINQLGERECDALSTRDADFCGHTQEQLSQIYKTLEVMLPSLDGYRKGHCMIELARINYDAAVPIIIKHLEDDPVIKHHVSYALSLHDNANVDEVFDRIWKNNGGIQ